MWLFHTPRPRKFHHDFMYVDEKKELLETLKARYYTGKEENTSVDDYHEKMANRVHEAMRAHQKGRERKAPLHLLPLGMMALLMLLLLLMVWFCFR